MTKKPKFSTTMAWNKTHWVVQFYCDDRLVSENTLTQGVTICPKDLTSTDLLREKIRQLCALQHQAEFDSPEYHAITEEIAHFRASSSEAERLCDEYDDHLR